VGKPKPPLMLQDNFCQMLAEGALELLYEQTPKLREALDEFKDGDYGALCLALADQFKKDYREAVKPDPDDPEPAEKVTSIR